MTSFSVAIVGGGLAGCTFANGLMKHPNISFHVFEGKPNFSELGAGVGLSKNAIAALEAMGHDMRQMLDRAGGMQEEITKILMIGQVVSSYPGSMRVHRARWLQQLLDPVPKEWLHAGKKLARIETNDVSRPVFALFFEDGSSHQSDIVIGADGIRSHVRRAVLGEQDACLEPTFAGFQSARTVISTEAALQHLGRDVFDPIEKHQTAVLGGGNFFLYSLLDEGKKCFIVAATRAKEVEWQGAIWKKPLTREYLEEELSSRPGPFARGVLECFMAAENPELSAQWQSAPARTFYSGKICMIGDAAHATTPWQGSGGGMSVEDAAVMEAILGKVQDVEEIETAFRVFDQTRRARTQRVVDSSRAVGEIFTHPELTPEERAAALKDKWRLIMQFDVAKHIRDAVDCFVRERADLADGR